MITEKVYQSFYTKNASIVNYMVKNLLLENGLKVLDPCAGDGVFVDALLATDPSLNIDAFELNPVAFSKLSDKYETHPNVNLFNKDTLLDDTLGLYSTMGGLYDRIIANPPYGAWQDHDKRKLLKQLFDGLYVKESYTLFLYRCIHLLRDGGRLVFIIPDTFLNLHLHKVIRKLILTNTKVNEIALFPSSFFPNVHFGYSDLSILSLQKCSSEAACLSNDFTVLRDMMSVSDIEHSNGTKTKFNQGAIYNSVDHAFFVNGNNRVSKLINNATLRVGDVASCVTGFYSGNDKKFLMVSDPELHRNGCNYKTLSSGSVFQDKVLPKNILDGISDNCHFVPIVKGGKNRYYKPDNWYMDWSQQAVAHYKSDKKSRFQNPQFYFKEGIAVPMVSSSFISASLLESRLFDQSIVGIFPAESSYVNYLLAFFNTKVCNTLIRTINPTANNSANYIKKIPFIEPSEVLFREIDTIIKKIITDLKHAKKYDTNLELKLEDIFQDIYKI